MKTRVELQEWIARQAVIVRGMFPWMGETEYAAKQRLTLGELEKMQATGVELNDADVQLTLRRICGEPQPQLQKESTIEFSYAEAFKSLGTLKSDQLGENGLKWFSKIISDNLRGQASIQVSTSSFPKLVEVLYNQAYAKKDVPFPDSVEDIIPATEPEKIVEPPKAPIVSVITPDTSDRIYSMKTDPAVQWTYSATNDFEQIVGTKLTR